MSSQISSAQILHGKDFYFEKRGAGFLVSSEYSSNLAKSQILGWPLGFSLEFVGVVAVMISEERLQSTGIPLARANGLVMILDTRKGCWYATMLLV